MSILALAPIPVGNAVIVQPIRGQLQGLRGIKAGNESDTTLYWEWGDQSGYLYPSDVAVFRPTGRSSAQLTFTPVTVLPPNLAVTSNLLLEFAYDPDDFAGDWPRQLSRLSQKVANLVPLLFSPSDSQPYVYPPGTNIVNQVLQLQPGMQSVRAGVDIQQGPPVVTYHVQLLGNVTGKNYFAAVATGVIGTIDQTFALHPQDTQLLWSINTVGSANPVKVVFSANMDLGFLPVALQTGPPPDGSHVPVDVRLLPTPTWSQLVRASGGGGASIASPTAPAGQQVWCQYAVYSMFCGATRLFEARVWDGATGGVQIGTGRIGNAGAAVGTAAEQITLYNMVSSVGSFLTFDIDFPTVPGEFQSITASGGYIQ